MLPSYWSKEQRRIGQGVPAGRTSGKIFRFSALHQTG
jgi:hypothetical protein